MAKTRERFTERFPQIARAYEKLPGDTVIHGELVAIDDDRSLIFMTLRDECPEFKF